MGWGGNSRPVQRVLFVDDDPHVLGAAARLLSLSGYQVITAQQLSAAERHIQAGQYDVLMTDLSMPEITGWDLAQRAKKRWPKKPVVLVTGWGFQLDAKQLKRGIVDGVLTKPFTLQDLNQTLGAVARR